jgi:hypothetical protein
MAIVTTPVRGLRRRRGAEHMCEKLHQYAVELNTCMKSSINIAVELNTCVYHSINIAVDPNTCMKSSINIAVELFKHVFGFPPMPASKTSGKRATFVSIFPRKKVEL